jgi:hypothetical protein
MTKDLFCSEIFTDVKSVCVGLMSCFYLGRLEKGSLIFDTKAKSFKQQWMGAGNKTTRQGNPHLAGAVCDLNLIYIKSCSTARVALKAIMYSVLS